MGFALRAACMITAAVPVTAGTHALTVGAVGSLTLGMMARVSLGHTGRPLKPGPAAVVAFVLISLAGALRVFGPMVAPLALPYATWLALSGAAWSIAFALFLIGYARVLVRPRADGKPG